MSGCEHCLHAIPVISDEPSEGPILKCRRYPPILFVFDGEVTQAFPDAVDRCGEYVESRDHGDDDW